MATEHEKELIRQRIDFAELVSAYTRLKKTGNRFMGVCPFHNDRGPSFSVDNEAKLFHCFGCKASGDLFTFVMKIENVEFGEAVELLAKRAGVTITRGFDSDGGEKSRQRDRVRKINEVAARYFYKVLTGTREGEAFQTYLEKRRVPPELARSFKLGASLESWDGLIRSLTKKGYELADMLAAGLVIRAENGRYYDRFRNRLIFPLTNVVGEIIGYAGRTLGADVAKYMNTPETVLFDKGRMLYALDKAKKHAESGGLILTEGYMDVIALHGAGVSNAVASMGTALTENQVDLLRRYTKKLHICYDSDFAGDNASMRGIELLVEKEFDVKVLTLPEGDDPDSVVARDGREGFVKFLEASEDYFDYFLRKTIARIGSDTSTQKWEVIKAMIGMIEKTPVEPLKTEQMRLLAERLGVEEKHVYSAQAQVHRNKMPVRRAREEPEALVNVFRGSNLVENEVLEILLTSNELALAVLTKADPEGFREPANRRFFEYCRNYCAENGGLFDIDRFYGGMHPQNIATMLGALKRDPAEDQLRRANAENVLRRFRSLTLDYQIARLKRDQELAEKEGDKERVIFLMKEIRAKRLEKDK